MPKQYTPENLVIHPDPASEDSGLIVSVTPAQAGWDTIHFQARRLEAGSSWSFATGTHELALVALGGVMQVHSERGDWQIGGRANVFVGLPHALYLPPDTQLTVTSAQGGEFAAAWVLAHPTPGKTLAPCLVTPKDVWVEIRGGGHATRQIHAILPPGFPSSRLVVVEVYTPGGNWSSYPPHKHDARHPERLAGAGLPLLEADLDEIYYYRMDRPEGYALQRIYTGPDSPLEQARKPIDAAVVAHDHDVVLVPEGYHPVSMPVGFTGYYLNVLAGSDQSLAASDDPQYAWVKGTFGERDPRVPLFDVSGAAGIR